ncbi:MAG: proteasome accessory factor PafA2 family protein, partial [Chthoniobacterales bacterium]
VRQGSMRRLTTEEEITDAVTMPPETTRAFFRGRAVSRFKESISSMQWDEVVFGSRGSRKRIELAHPAGGKHLDGLNAAMRGARDYETFVRLISAK